MSMHVSSRRESSEGILLWREFMEACSKEVSTSSRIGKSSWVIETSGSCYNGGISTGGKIVTECLGLMRSLCHNVCKAGECICLANFTAEGVGNAFIKKGPRYLGRNLRLAPCLSLGLIK